MARPIMRVFLLAALIVFLTGVSIFADEVELTTIVAKEASGICRVRQFVLGSGPDGPPVDNPGDRPEPLGIWTWLNATKQGEYYPAAPTGPETVDLVGEGGRVLKDKTLISLTGGGTASGAFAYACARVVGNETRSKSYGAANAITTPPTITDFTTSDIGGVTYIDSFEVSNLIGGEGIYGIINVTVIEYN